MKPNNIKQIWSEGRAAINGWLSVANSFTAEIMARQGYDSITVDLQHGVVDFQTAVAMIQAINTTETVPMVRVPWLEPGIIMKVLDIGAYGVICPMINSRAEAERLVSYVRYPPLGLRSFGPTRVNFSAGPNYATESNGELLCFAMIETREAVDRLEDIVATPGLSGIYIGPADLGLAFGHAPGFDRQESDLVALIRRIGDAAHRAGIKAALHNGSAAYAAKAAGWGFDLVTVSNDVRLLATAAAASVAEFRQTIWQHSQDKLIVTAAAGSGY